MKLRFLLACFATPLTAAALSSTLVAGCDIGLNDGLHNPGDEPGGVNLAFGDIAVSPDGKYVVFEQNDQLALGWVETGAIETLPIYAPARLAFSKSRDVVYVTTELGSLHALDISDRDNLWSVSTGLSDDPMLVVTKDDSRVAVGSSRFVALYDTAAGDPVATTELDRPIVDLELLPDDGRVLAVEEHVWPEDEQGPPTTEIHVISLEGGASRSFSVPNCADDIIVPSHGAMALLAPSLCLRPSTGSGHDPISYIDLTPGEEAFVKNLPGYGPVALTPDGTTAVGFLDLQEVEASLFEDPEQIPQGPRYHLMILDTETLSYDFAPYGEVIPRYALGPDGHTLLVDEPLGDTARIFDVETMAFRDVAGLSTYEQLSFTSDTKSAYVLSDWEQHLTGEESYVDYALFQLDVDSAKARTMKTDFRPRNINFSPDDARLFLRQSDTEICIYDLASESCSQRFVLEPSES
ncbi:MAG: hypothetical protein R3B72_10775 [Polyangiaceae bacterium]